MIVNFLLMLFCGVLGLTCHWFKRWARRQTFNNFVDYMRCHRASSISSVITMIVAIFAMAPSADIQLTMETLGLAFSAGYMVDSVVNTDSRL